MSLIIDDFFDQEDFLKIQGLFLGPKMPWYYLPTISVPSWISDKIVDQYAIETDACQCLILDRSRNYLTEEYVVLYPYLMKMMSKLGYTEENLYRVRTTMKWPKPGIGSEKYNIPHIDATWPHKTILFYLNNSDGDTRLFHQVQPPMKRNLEDINENADAKELDEYAKNFINTGFTVKESISPKENRLIMFDGMQYHTAGIPVNSERRVILNINIRE